MSINFEFKNLDFVMFRDNTWAVFVEDPSTKEGIFVCQTGYLELADYDTNLCCDSGEHPDYDVMVVIRGCKSFARAKHICEERGILITEEIVFDRRKHIDFKSLDKKHLIVFRNGTVGKPDPVNEAFVTTENHSLKYSCFDEKTGQHTSNSLYGISRIVEMNSENYEIKVIFKR